MIGNDIVDLKRAGKESDWRRKGFLSKVFLKHEQDLIKDSGDQDQMVWLLWSMKEAAYKAHQRQYRLRRSLNWHRFSCYPCLDNELILTGRVLVEGIAYHSTSRIFKDHIHTIVQNNFDGPVVFPCWEASSGEVKSFLLNDISRLWSVPKKQLSLKKDTEGIPFVSFGNGHYLEQFSFSDHGRFAGFCLSLKIP